MNGDFNAVNWIENGCELEFDLDIRNMKLISLTHLGTQLELYDFIRLGPHVIS